MKAIGRNVIFALPVFTSPAADRREIVSAATGRNIREILATEILDPLGFRWTNYGVATKMFRWWRPATPPANRLPAPIAKVFKMAVGGTMHQIIPFSNTPQFLTSVVPSSNTVSTAHECPVRRDPAPRRRTRRRAGAAARNPARRDEGRRGGCAPTSHRAGAAALGYRIHAGLQEVRSVRPRRAGAFGHTGLTDIAVWADPERGSRRRWQRQAGRTSRGQALSRPAGRHHRGDPAHHLRHL